MLSFRKMMCAVLVVDLTRGLCLLAAVGALTLAGVAVAWPEWLSGCRVDLGRSTPDYDEVDIAQARMGVESDLNVMQEAAVRLEVEHDSNESEIAEMAAQLDPLRKRIREFRDFLASEQQEYSAKGQAFSREEVKEELILQMAELRRLDQHLVDKRAFNEGLERDLGAIRSDVVERKLIASDLEDREERMRTEVDSLGMWRELPRDSRDYKTFLKEVDKQLMVKRKLRSSYVSDGRIPIEYDDTEILAQCDALLGD